MNSEGNVFETTVDNDENDILSTAVRYMETFLREANGIVAEFRSGIYTRLGDLTSLFEGFQWIYIAVNKINDEHNAKIDIDSQRVEETLKTASEALTNSDIVLLTDILEYEIIELVQGWYGGE